MVSNRIAPTGSPAWRPAARARAGVRSGPPAARRARLRLWTSGVLVVGLGLAVVVVPPLADLDQQLIDLAASNQSPSPAHPFGTDAVGRDLLLRCAYGLRVSFTVGLVAALVATGIGTAVGLVAATFGGWTDRLLMRAVDVVSSVPHLLLGIFIVAIFRPSLTAVIVSIALTHWLSTARIVRSEVLSLRERPFIDAAVAGGASRWRVLHRHLLPNVAPQAGLAAVLIVPHAIWHETALSFLGLGLPSHLASLGNLLKRRPARPADRRLVDLAVPRRTAGRCGIGGRRARRRLARSSLSHPTRGADAVTADPAATRSAATAARVPPAAQPRRAGVPPAARGRLVVQNLSMRFRLTGATVAAVNDVSFDLPSGWCLALVGESGCGKSVMVSALLGLLPGNADTAGTAHLYTASAGADGMIDATDPVELLSAPEGVLARQVRGRQVGLVPQSPAAHLTPVRTAGDQLREVLRTLRPDAADLPALAVATAARVGLPAEALDLYPHELSGGMAQRVATALALAGDAWLLLADEPTTGLDRGLLDRTLDELRALVDAGRAVLLITHDLAAATRIADTVAVMYAGRLVELGPTSQVLDAPRHHYTAGLVGALPDRGFRPIAGMPPELSDLPSGCAFAARCPAADSTCQQRPELQPTAPPTESAATDAPLARPDPSGAHLAACHHPC